MPQHATVTDHVTYRPGEGVPIVIPRGPIEVDFTTDSATLSWMEENGAAGLAAIPLAQYTEFVAQKRITPASPHVKHSGDLVDRHHAPPQASPRLRD